MQFLYLNPGMQLRDCNLAIAHEAFSFPGGEQHVRVTGPCANEEVWIVSRMTDARSFMQFAIAVDAVRNAGGIPCGFIPYLPYAQQDRIMVPGDPLSIRVIADLLRSLDLKRLRIYDPHSDVAPALLPGVEVIDNSEFVKWAIKQTKTYPSIASPDAGAMKKIFGLAKKIKFGGLVFGSKIRDLQTGDIIRQYLTGDDITGRSCLIVDDIIVGGRTFTELAKLLRDKGAESVYLAVSHGVFSQSIVSLREHIDGIFVTDSRPNPTGPEDADFIKVYQLGFNG